MNSHSIHLLRYASSPTKLISWHSLPFPTAQFSTWYYSWWRGCHYSVFQYQNLTSIGLCLRGRRPRMSLGWELRLSLMFLWFMRWTAWRVVGRLVLLYSHSSYQPGLFTLSCWNLVVLSLSTNDATWAIHLLVTHLCPARCRVCFELLSFQKCHPNCRKLCWICLLVHSCYSIAKYDFVSAWSIFSGRDPSFVGRFCRRNAILCLIGVSRYSNPR